MFTIKHIDVFILSKEHAFFSEKHNHFVWMNNSSIEWLTKCQSQTIEKSQTVFHCCSLPVRSNQCWHECVYFQWQHRTTSLDWSFTEKNSTHCQILLTQPLRMGIAQCGVSKFLKIGDVHWCLSWILTKFGSTRPGCFGRCTFLFWHLGRLGAVWNDSHSSTMWDDDF